MSTIAHAHHWSRSCASFLCTALIVAYLPVFLANKIYPATRCGAARLAAHAGSGTTTNSLAVKVGRLPRFAPFAASAGIYRQSSRPLRSGLGRSRQVVSLTLTFCGCTLDPDTLTAPSGVRRECPEIPTTVFFVLSNQKLNPTRGQTPRHWHRFCFLSRQQAEATRQTAENETGQQTTETRQ